MAFKRQGVVPRGYQVVSSGKQAQVQSAACRSLHTCSEGINPSRSHQSPCKVSQHRLHISDKHQLNWHSSDHKGHSTRQPPLWWVCLSDLYLLQYKSDAVLFVDYSSIQMKFHWAINFACTFHLLSILVRLENQQYIQYCQGLSLRLQLLYEPYIFTIHLFLKTYSRFQIDRNKTHVWLRWLAQKLTNNVSSNSIKIYQ